MTSSNGNFFLVTGPVCEEFTGHRWIPLTKVGDAELDVFFHLCLNKRLSKQWWSWWFEMPSHSLWCHCNNVTPVPTMIPLQWHHMSIKQSQIRDTLTDCSTVCLGWQQRKHWNSSLSSYCEENPMVTSRFPTQQASSVETASMSLHHCVAMASTHLDWSPGYTEFVSIKKF